MTANATVEGPEVLTGVPPARSARARIMWTLVGLLLAAAIVPAVALSIIGSTAYEQLTSTPTGVYDPDDRGHSRGEQRRYHHRARYREQTRWSPRRGSMG